MAQFSITLDENLSGLNYDGVLEQALSAVDTCHAGTSAPTTDLSAGKLWLDTSNYDLYIYNGTSWRKIIDSITSSGVTLRASDGTVLEPSITFGDDSNTGIYRDASNVMGFTAAGGLKFKMGTTLLSNNNGSSSAPQFSFVADPNTGMYRQGTDRLGLTAGGIANLSVNATGVGIGSITPTFPLHVNGNAHFENNITVDGSVDGRDLASDGSKLDGIESGATADQTDAQILTAIKNVHGAGSGLDADTLDGVHAADLGGNFELVDSVTNIGGSSSVAFDNVFTTTDRNYVIFMDNILPATDNAVLNFRFHNSSTTELTGDYRYVMLKGTGSAGADRDTNSSVELHSDGQSNVTADGAINGTITLYDPASSNRRSSGIANLGHSNISGEPTVIQNSFRYSADNTSAAGFRLYLSAGNFTSGRVFVYKVTT
jgi:hypothetical protein